jgi:hypothetical protein
MLPSLDGVAPDGLNDNNAEGDAVIEKTGCPQG